MGCATTVDVASLRLLALLLCRYTQTKSILHDANFSLNREGGTAHAVWPRGQVRAFEYRALTERVFIVIGVFVVLLTLIGVQPSFCLMKMSW